MNKDKAQESQRLRRNWATYWPWAVIIIIILLTAAIRIRLLDVPLERDEGEYAYSGQLILQGTAPYGHVYNMKMPGIYAAYAVILACFGQTQGGIHLGLLIINSVTVLLLFVLAKDLFGPVGGIAGGAAFAVLSLGQYVQGLFANAEHFVILPALGGILLLRHSVNRTKLWSLSAGAVLLGLACLMKQHGATFVVFGGLYLFFSELRRRPFAWRPFVVKGLLFITGVLLPFVVTCFVLWRAGVFEKFWFWTFDYARAYVSDLPLSIGLKTLQNNMTLIIGSAVLLWIFAGIGLIGLLWHKEIRQQRGFVGGFLIFSFLAVCPGFYFRSHYFVLLLPAVALLSAAGIVCARGFIKQYKLVPKPDLAAVLLVLGLFFFSCYQQRDFFFTMSPTEASLATYGGNPFSESLEIAKYIRENSSKEDTIAILGSEPQIYFYSNRRSATGYIYTYALMESHEYALKMQQEMINEIEEAKPKFLVFVKISTSWLPEPNSEMMIFEWFHQYRQKYYEDAGIIDIMLPATVYFWGEEAVGYVPRSKDWIAVLQRKNQN